jgi:hypothetical protein
MDGIGKALVFLALLAGAAYFVFFHDVQKRSGLGGAQAARHMHNHATGEDMDPQIMNSDQ